MDSVAGRSELWGVRESVRPESWEGGEPELPNMRFSKPPWPEILRLLFPASMTVCARERALTNVNMKVGRWKILNLHDNSLIVWWCEMEGL